MGYKLCPKCNLNLIKEDQELCTVCSSPSTERRTRSYGGKKEHVVAQSNVAFKCSYCDGGKVEGQFGFNGLCSESNLLFNVNERKYTWCKSDECLCMHHTQGALTRQELEQKYQQGVEICYESKVLKNWRMCSGRYTTGVNKGKPMKLLGVRTDSLAVLTSCYPNSQENERFIFGVYIVLRSSEGDDIREGYAEAHPQYMLKMTEEQAAQLRFWNYYHNKPDKKQELWNSGLHRNLTDDVAVQILKDVVKVKQGTPDEIQAKNILEYFCQKHGVNA